MTRDEAIELVLPKAGAANSYLGVPWSEILSVIDVSDDQFQGICSRFINAPVVEWASKRESYQCFSGTNTAPSKDNASVQVAA